MRRNLDELVALRAKLRKALSVRVGSKVRRSLLRKAYLQVSQELSDTQLDILARLQFLEGALKSRSAKEKLEWTKGKPLRSALAEATAFIQENYGTLPEISRYTWLTKESTGFYRDVRRRLVPMLKQISTAPDDIMQMLLMGMNPSGETFYLDENNEKVDLDRMFQVAGFKSRSVVRRDFENRDGRLTPYDFSNILAAWAQKKALNMIKVEQRDKGRREKYWGEEIRAPESETTWEEEAQDVSSVLPGEAVHEDWGSQSEAWAFSSMLFHTDTPEAQRVRDWLYNVVFPKHTAVDITMRTLFDMLEEGNWDVAGSKPLLRLQKMNAELAERVGKALGKDMSPNEKGQYTQLNAAREAGFKRITQATEDLKTVDVRALRAEEENLQKFLEGLAQRAKGVPDPKAKADLSAAHREQQANRKAVKDLRTQIESLQAQAVSGGGVNPRDRDNLSKVKEELDAVRRLMAAKRKEYRVLQAEATTSAKPPMAFRKQLAAAQKEIETLGRAVEAADAAFLEAQRAAETSPRLTPKLRKQLDNTRKAKRNARLQYTVKRKALDALTAEAVREAVLPKKLQATMTKVEGELQVLSAKVKDISAKAKVLEERVSTSGGPSPKDIAAKEAAEVALAEAKAQLRKTRNAIAKKQEEIASLQATAQANVKPPANARKKVTQAKKDLAQARKDGVAAQAELKAVQTAFDKYKRPPKVLQEKLMAAQKADRRARTQFTRTKNLLDVAIAEATAAPSAAAPSATAQKSIALAEQALAALQQEAKSTTVSIKRITADLLEAEARLESSSSGVAQRNNAEAISNLQTQLASYEQKSEETRQQIYLLENATKGGPPTPEEKSEAVEATRTLKIIRGKLSLLTMIDAMELSGLGFGRLRKAGEATDLWAYQSRFQFLVEEVESHLVRKYDWAHCSIEDDAHRWSVFKMFFQKSLGALWTLVTQIAEQDPKQRARYQRMYASLRKQVSKLELRALKQSASRVARIAIRRRQAKVRLFS